MWDPMASLSLVSSECDQHTPCGQTMSVQSSSEDDFSGEDLSGSFEDNDRTLSSNHNTKESSMYFCEFISAQIHAQQNQL